MSESGPTLTAAARSKLPVLVPNADAIGMIGVIRSLGRAGYPVHACSSQADALGLQSKFALRGECCPAYDDPGFLRWLDRYVSTHDIRCIVPSEGFLLAVRPALERYLPLLPVKPDAALIYGSLSKPAVIARLLETAAASAHLPPTLLLDDESALPGEEELAALGLPIFIKGDSTDDREGHANIVAPEHTAAAARERILALRPRYRRLLVQGFVPGQGTGAYFLMRDGKIIQEFMNRCLHEVPHTGGYCSLRDSWWHEAMMADARAKAAHLGWEGVIMFEYRWDPQTDRFWFIEINARFWAALHVALYAGVDFPTMLVDQFHGAGVRTAPTFPLGLQVRYTIPFEVGYVSSRWKDKRLPLFRRLGSIAGWFLRFLDPRIYSDLFFPGDRALYFRQWGRFIREIFR